VPTACATLRRRGSHAPCQAKRWTADLCQRWGGFAQPICIYTYVCLCLCPSLFPSLKLLPGGPLKEGGGGRDSLMQAASWRQPSRGSLCSPSRAKIRLRDGHSICGETPREGYYLGTADNPPASFGRFGTRDPRSQKQPAGLGVTASPPDQLLVPRSCSHEAGGRKRYNPPCRKMLITALYSCTSCTLCGHREHTHTHTQTRTHTHTQTHTHTFLVSVRHAASLRT
jgi:hypothetical protein